jgi:hypothetical protein
LSATASALDRFRLLALRDAALQAALTDAENSDAFARRAALLAASRGIALAPDAVLACLRPDPLGLSRWDATPVCASDWPPVQWLPFQVAALNGQAVVDWAHFGAAPLTHPFFEDSIRRALSHPLNRMLRYRMTLGDLVARAARAPSLRPNGFIFHMSRCGSTLVSQMLASLPHNVVISEAAPIDATVQIGQVETLAAMVAAFGRKRSGNERGYFLKLDCWHALALPLFRRAFPEVPWVFLYRDPVEVLVSQVRQRGTQMVPEIVRPSLYGLGDIGGIPDEDYCARVLEKICSAASANMDDGGGLPVNYSELPQAVWTKILPHFGVTPNESDDQAMRRAARQDAKAPRSEFVSDSAAKQHEASVTTRMAAKTHLAGVYRTLEALRGAAQPA